jgi:metal-dependent amidase/aminoacylase/carboxypeptidase family protein
MGNENTVIRAAERTRRVLGPLDEVCPGVEELYLDLHQNPELSLQETETAAKAASRLRCSGYEVTERAGGTGVVAML